MEMIWLYNDGFSFSAKELHAKNASKISAALKTRLGEMKVIGSENE